MGMRGKNKIGWTLSCEDSFVKMFTQCDHDGNHIKTTCIVKPHPEPINALESVKVDYTKPRGFGDTLNKWISAAGFKVKCGGCGKRQYWLNKVLPYK